MGAEAGLGSGEAARKEEAVDERLSARLRNAWRTGQRLESSPGPVVSEPRNFGPSSAGQRRLAEHDHADGAASVLISGWPLGLLCSARASRYKRPTEPGSVVHKYPASPPSLPCDSLILIPSLHPSLRPKYLQKPWPPCRAFAVTTTSSLTACENTASHQILFCLPRRLLDPCRPARSPLTSRPTRPSSRRSLRSLRRQPIAGL